MLTHGNLTVNLRQVQAASEDGPLPDDVSFGLLPMFHIFGLNVVLGTALAVGGCVLLVGAGASFPAGAALGFACAVGCAVVWAAYSVTSRRMSAVPTE